jgi:glucosamine 6-phosphate synthetase-like amidotransferase/phosphosugar isomerase protein
VEKKEIEKKNDQLITHILSLSEGRNWRSSLTKTDLSLQVFEKESWLSTIETIFIVGHGTSLATALVAESWFCHISRLHARALPAFYFNNYIEDFLINPERTLVIGISCSGNTTSVVQSLENAKKYGAITICLSGEDEVACAKVAKYRIITDAHLDKHIKVSAYTISHIYLLIGAYRLAVQLGKRNGRLSPKLVNYWQEQLENALSTLRVLPEIFEEMNEICNKVIEVSGANFAVLGTGPNYGTMKEGALKISEFCWKFGTGEELDMAAFAKLILALHY